MTFVFKDFLWKKDEIHWWYTKKIINTQTIFNLKIQTESTSPPKQLYQSCKLVGLRNSEINKSEFSIKNKIMVLYSLLTVYLYSLPISDPQVSEMSDFDNLP